MKPKAYRRDRKKFDPDYRPKDKALQLLRVFARYRYTRSNFARALCGFTRRTGNYHLEFLWNNYFVDKPKGQGNGYNSLNDSHVYEITDKGMKYLDEEVYEATNLTREQFDLPKKNFRHDMMICDLLQSIELGTQGTGCRFITQSEILEKSPIPDPLKFPASIHYQGTRFATYGRPDAVFGIEYPNGKTRLYILEAEHAGALKRKKSRHLSSTFKKILVYEDVQKQKIVYKHLRKHNFNVLFGCATRGRIKNAIAEITAHYGTNALCLFAYMPTHESISKSPEPRPELFTGLWERGGLDPVSIKETPAE